MLIIAGHVHVDAEHRNEYVDSFRDLIERCRAAHGCLDASISADPLDPTRVNVLERWQSWKDVVAWREVVNPPDVDIEMISDHVKMYTATDERSPFEREAEPPPD